MGIQRSRKIFRSRFNRKFCIHQDDIEVWECVGKSTTNEKPLKPVLKIQSGPKRETPGTNQNMALSLEKIFRFHRSLNSRYQSGTIFHRKRYTHAHIAYTLRKESAERLQFSFFIHHLHLPAVELLVKVVRLLLPD